MSVSYRLSGRGADRRGSFNTGGKKSVIDWLQAAVNRGIEASVWGCLGKELSCSLHVSFVLQLIQPA